MFKIKIIHYSNKPENMKAVINVILDLFGKYRQASPLAIKLDSNSGSSSPATSTLSELSETSNLESKVSTVHHTSIVQLITFISLRKNTKEQKNLGNNLRLGGILLKKD